MEREIRLTLPVAPGQKDRTALVGPRIDSDRKCTTDTLLACRWRTAPAERNPRPLDDQEPGQTVGRIFQILKRSGATTFVVVTDDNDVGVHDQRVSWKAPALRPPSIKRRIG